MRLILAQPSSLRFQWELEVLLTNLQQFGDLEIDLLFTKHNDAVPNYLASKYKVRCFIYADFRHSKAYLPAVRPYLLWQHFAKHPELCDEQYLYLDADIIFREWPDFATLPFDRSKVYGADVDSYIGLEYILKCERGMEIASKMAEICGITVEEMRHVPGIGAQLVLNGTSAEFWRRSYDDTFKLYNMMLPITSNIQKWTAEMWAQQWGWVREGKTLVISPELSFSRPTDSIEVWDKHKIMHNAGVTGAGEMFFKGNYSDKTPFSEDFSQINPNKVSAKYVEAIQKVVP